MNIHNIIYVLFSLIASAFVACDTIEENERYIEKEIVETKRNVLLEDFTGQNCPNCPQAHRVVNALKEQYGESVVAVSIHAGHFAYEEGRFEPHFQTFKTEESNVFAFFNCNGTRRPVIVTVPMSCPGLDSTATISPLTRSRLLEL